MKKSSMKYSKIISGTMTWGKWGKQFTTEEIISFMNHCIDNNVTTFDHADIYGGYTTEADFGKALNQSNIKREDIQLITKCGIQLNVESRKNKINHYNYTKDYIIWSVDTSLKNLKTDYLDALLLHRPSPLMEPYEIMEAAAKLAHEGKINDFGVSNFTPSQVELIASEVPVTINQVEFSLTQNEAMYNGTLDQTRIKNITSMAWSPLGCFYKEDTEQTRRIHKQLGELLEKYNATDDQLLLAWLMRHPSNIYPVVGTTDKKRITNAIKAAEIKLDLEDWFLLLKASHGHDIP